MAAALKLARAGHYARLRREDIAREAGVSQGLVTLHLGTMVNLPRSIMRAAVRERCLVVIGQGLAAGDKQARKAPPDVREAAAARLAG